MWQLTLSLLLKGRPGVEDAQRAHKLLKVNHIVLLDVKHLEHFVNEDVAAPLRLEQRQSKLVLVYETILCRQSL